MSATTMTSGSRRDGPETRAEKPPQATETTEYCSKLQQWMWQYYWGYAGWQSWLALSAVPLPPPWAFPPPGTSLHTPATPASTPGGSGQQPGDPWSWYSYPYPLSFPASSGHQGGVQTGQSWAATAAPAAVAQQQNENPPQAGKFMLYFVHNILALSEKYRSSSSNVWVLCCLS